MCSKFRCIYYPCDGYVCSECLERNEYRICSACSFSMTCKRSPYKNQVKITDKITKGYK